LRLGLSVGADVRRDANRTLEGSRESWPIFFLCRSRWAQQYAEFCVVPSVHRCVADAAVRPEDNLLSALIMLRSFRVKDFSSD